MRLITNCCTYQHRLQFHLQTWVTHSTLLGSVKEIELQTKYNLIHEKEWTGDTVTDICTRYHTSRKSYYKWKNRYLENRID